MPTITSDFDPDRFPKVPPETSPKVTDPEKWTPQEVNTAQNIAASQYGLLNMNDYQLHQCARYDSDKQNYMGKRLWDSGYQNDNVAKMVAMTPEHYYYSLRKKQQRGFHE